MSTKSTIQTRRVHIGNAAVDSGMLMIVDPCYVLPDKYAEKHWKEKGIVKASDAWDKDYEAAMEFCHSNEPSFVIERDENGKAVVDPKSIRTQFTDIEPLTHEQHKQIACGAVCTTGRGDGLYPVYAVYVGNTLVSMEVRFDQD